MAVGELAAARERNTPAANCKAAESSGAHHRGDVALCLSPSAAKSRQEKAPAGPAATTAINKTAVMTPQRYQVGAALQSAYTTSLLASALAINETFL